MIVNLSGNMGINKFAKRPLVENCEIVRASTFLRACLFEFEYIKNLNLDLRKEEDVKKLIEIVNKTVYLTSKNLLENNEIKNPVQITYTRSNLKKGFIFWFVCQGCFKKASLLYFTPYSNNFLCRNCHRLTYEKNNTKEGKIIKELLVNPSKKIVYLSSNRLKDIIYLLETEEIIKKIKEKAKEKVDKIVKNVNNLNRSSDD